MENTTTRERAEENARVLKSNWLAEIDAGIEHLIPIIKRIFKVEGIFGFIVDPFIDLAAVSFVKSSRKTAIKQMKITIDCAIEAIETGNTTTTISKYAPGFIELDEMIVNSQKKHPLFPALRQSVYDEFALRIEEMTWLLVVKPPTGTTSIDAPGIYKIAYNNEKAKAVTIHEKQLGYIEQRLQMVEKNENLVKIPFGLKGKVFQVVTAGLKFTKNRYREVIDNWFS